MRLRLLKALKYISNRDKSKVKELAKLIISQLAETAEPEELQEDYKNGELLHVQQPPVHSVRDAK